MSRYFHGFLVHESVTAEKVLAVALEDDNLGICLLCGSEQGGVEPDAERYRCEACGQTSVYGAEYLVVGFV